MRPSVGQNISCAVGGAPQHLDVTFNSELPVCGLLIFVNASSSSDFILSYGVLVNQAVNLSRGPCVESADEGVDNNLLTAIYIFQVHNKLLSNLHNTFTSNE